MKPLSTALIWLPKVLIRTYQRLVSPWKPPSCRFRPTCSEYAIQALELHGLLRGSWLFLLRLLRCQPFCKGGYDPVPGSSPDGGSPESETHSDCETDS